MEDKIKVELSNGSVVYVIEVWDCCNGCNDCGSKVEVYATKRCRKKDFLCEIQGTIPKGSEFRGVAEGSNLSKLVRNDIFKSHLISY